MKRIFITGINGFVGSTLANYFCSKGFEVSGLGRQERLSEIVDARCGYTIGDITNHMAPIKADVVIHAAALGSDTAPYEDLYRNNVNGTQNVLDASEGVNQFIYISTSSVYNFQDKKMIENQGGQGFEKLSFYGQTKFLAEEKVLESVSIPCRTIFRPHAIYGVNDRLILPRLLKLKKGGRVILPRHTTSQVTLTNVRNLVAAIELSMNSPEKEEVYNICDDEVYDLKEIILRLLSEVTGEQMKAFHIPKPIWETIIGVNEKLHLSKDVSRYASELFTRPSMIDVNHIKRNLGFEPQKTLPESFVKIGKWVKENGGYKSIIQSN